MSESIKIKIGQLFNVEKGSLQSSKCVSGDYDFITASSEWKTHKEYSHHTEALIVAVAASGSLGRVHYVNGKFISSDLCFILTPKDAKTYPVDLGFYLHVFKAIRQDLVQRTATGTSKLAINKGNFENYEVPYFDIVHQSKYREKLIKFETEKDSFLEKGLTQNSLLKRLRQQILQDAISGKLTADWRAENPDIEPASKLLEQIKAEKDKLILEKKVKKGKKQDPERQSDLIFDIPKTWEWVSLDDISQYITDGTHQTPTYVIEGKTFLSAQNVKPFRFIPENHRFVSESAYKDYIHNRKAEKNDILFARVGAGIGEAAVIDRDMDFAFYVSLGLIKTFKEKTNPDYICLILNSPYGVKYAKGNISSKGGSAGNFNLGRVRSFLVPLPPQSEQKAIISKAEKLMEYVTQLEEKIANNANYAEMLMQAFLGEVFK